MSAVEEIEEARADLETLLADVLRAAFGEEPEVLTPDVSGPVPDAAGGVPSVTARLAIDDGSDGALLGVRVAVTGRLAHVLAARMFACDGPTADDLLDAVGELVNIAGGNVKALLVTGPGSTDTCPARLSLPSAVLGTPVAAWAGRVGAAAATTIRAIVLGDVAELTLTPHVDGEGLIWPPVLGPEVLEGQP